MDDHELILNAIIEAKKILPTLKRGEIKLESTSGLLRVVKTDNIYVVGASSKWLKSIAIEIQNALRGSHA